MTTCIMVVPLAAEEEDGDVDLKDKEISPVTDDLGVLVLPLYL